MSTKNVHPVRWVLTWLTVLGLLASIYAPAMAQGSQSEAALATAIVVVPQGNPIQIAFLMYYGWPNAQDSFDAVQMAIDDYGLIKGWDIQRNDFDSGCDPTSGENAATEAVTNTQNLGVIGPLCSSSTTGAAPVLESAGVVMISHGNSMPGLSTYGPTIFNRVMVPDPDFESWHSRIKALPSVLSWQTEFEVLYGHTPEDIAKFAYDAATLLLTRIDQNSTVNGDGDLEVDRATLAAAVRSTTNFAGVTDFISLDSSTGDRLNLFEGAGTRYVATTGDDTANDCTGSAAPCASVQRGIAMAGADEEVWVAGGTYTENLTIQISATVLGGYEPISWTRNTELSPTIINGLGGPVAPGDWDETQVRYPYVLQQGSLYHMWYSGLDVYGVQRIGYATSPDGVNWTKHPANPVLDVGAVGEWDSAYIEAPMVIYEGGEFKMWYSGGDGSHAQIGYATSLDGIAWTKSAANPVLEIGGQPWNNLDIVHPYVLHEGGIYKMWVVAIGDDGPSISYATSPDGLVWTWDANSPLFGRDWEAWVWRPFVLNQGGSYQMWYSAWAGQGLVAYATAPDEITWTKQGSVLTGTVGAWDEGFVNDPSVLQVTGTYTMYYDNNGNGIGLATSTDGITWTKPLTQPVLTRGEPTQWTDPVIQIESDNAAVTLDGLTITGGESFNAGGIFAQGAALTLNNCIVRDNIAHGSSDGWAGGGILSGGPLTILDSQIINNQVDSGASGVRTNGWILLMVNSLVANNSGDFAIHTNGPANLLNITVVNNESGVLINPPFSATLVITNSIFYSTGLAVATAGSASVQVSYSDIQGGITGTANIDADPLFVDYANGDYHLLAGSPAIDSGTNTGAPDHDLDQSLRPLDGDDDNLAVTDMGAYEYEPPVAVIYHTFLPVALR